MQPWMRALPNGKLISALGFGCSSVWAQDDFTEELAQRILHILEEEGVNHFDTSPSYGKGLGERRLGEYLCGKNLQQLIISTKVGWNLIDGRIVRNFDRDTMSQSFTDSLARLGVDKVDILYLHGPSIADLNEGVFNFFSEQKALGRVTYSGVNTFDPATLDYVANTPIDAVMLQYNVGDLGNSEQIETLQSAGKIVISGTAVARAKFDLMKFVPRDRASLWYLLRMIRRDPGFILSGYQLRKRLVATGEPMVDAAIQFAVSHPKIISHLFGTSKVENAVSNARAGHRHLNPASLAALRGL